MNCLFSSCIPTTSHQHTQFIHHIATQQILLNVKSDMPLLKLVLPQWCLTTFRISSKLLTTPFMMWPLLNSAISQTTTPHLTHSVSHHLLPSTYQVHTCSRAFALTVPLLTMLFSRRSSASHLHYIQTLTQCCILWRPPSTTPSLHPLLWYCCVVFCFYSNDLSWHCVLYELTIHGGM